MEHISLFEIVETNFKGVVLDVFYLLSQNSESGITKKEIAQALFEAEGGEGEVPGQKFRWPIQDAISKLEGALLVYSERSGTQDYFFLTQYGQAAESILGQYLEDNPRLYRNTIILKNLQSEG